MADRDVDSDASSLVAGQGLGHDLSRRDLFKAVASVGIGVSLVATLGSALAQDASTAETDPTKMPPQKGDWFVFAGQQNKGKIISDSDIPLGGPQILAWPAQVSNKSSTPVVEVIRDGNNQNAVLLARFAEDAYSPDTKQYTTASGVVAYAATCTHQCCQVTGWIADQKLFQCPCHGSEYDPLNHAQETPTSPAPRPLPQLPLVADASTASVPTVASGFRTQVGCGPVTH